MTGCPGLSQTFDAYGTKVMIDPQICVADSYCTKIKVCPSFELVEVANYHPSLYKPETKKSAVLDLPLPQIKKTLSDIANGDDYRLVVTGVGGSGVTTISRVLAEAAKSMGGRSDIDFKFVDQKGLAQRNGNVTSHLALFKLGKSHAQVTPMGGADLLLSPDLLDGSQHLAFLNNNGAVVLDEKFQIPLSILLDRGINKGPINEKSLQGKLKNLLGERLTLLPMKETCENVLGKSVYASAMILGAAFQKGLLPFELKDLEEAFSRTMKKGELENNLQAFSLGRGLVLGKNEKVAISKNELQINLFKQSIKESSLFYRNGLVDLFEENLKQLKVILPTIDSDHLGQYLHDMIIFDRGDKFPDFLSQATKLAALYQNDLLIMAVRTLAKTYFIKDEVFIAHMMVSPMRRINDEENYRSIGKSYKKTFINRPSFDLGEKKIEFDFSPRPWMLKTMRHARVLRNLLPEWHKKERAIAGLVRAKILSSELSYSELKQLENIKGYRDVRYDSGSFLPN